MTWYNSQLISAPHSRVEVVKVNSVNSHWAVNETAFKHAKKASKTWFFHGKKVELVLFEKKKNSVVGPHGDFVGGHQIDADERQHRQHAMKDTNHGPQSFREFGGVGITLVSTTRQKC